MKKTFLCLFTLDSNHSLFLSPENRKFKILKIDTLPMNKNEAHPAIEKINSSLGKAFRQALSGLSNEILFGLFWTPISADGVLSFSSNEIL